LLRFQGGLKGCQVETKGSGKAMRGQNLAAIGLSLATLLVFAGCSRRGGNGAGDTLPTAAVQAQVAEDKTRVATEETVGTVRAKLHAVIEAKVSGKIDQMLVVPGQHVSAGVLLVTIDAREIQAQYDQALAVRQQAESDLKRATDLFHQNILSPSEFDAAESRFHVADAAAAAARTLLDYTRVKAPFAGVITRKDADVGDLAVPGKPLLEMEDARNLRLEADVPEALLGKLALGDKLPVRIGVLETNLEGVVSEIAPSADSSSRTFLVKLDLPAVPDLRAGQFGRVAVPVGKTSALRVPASAVVQRGQMELLFVVADGHAHMRIVKTGKRVGNEVELVSGVDPGEQVIVNPSGHLVDGQPVAVNP
jgi:RND family efflux transporter MFP subunit